MQRGFIKLYRRLHESKLWTKEKFTRGQAWVDLLFLANHRPGYIRMRGVKVDVDRGQVGWSERDLARRWKWSRNKVRKYTTELEETEHQIKQQKNNVTTLITILNYDLYQGNGTPNDTTKTAEVYHKRTTELWKPALSNGFESPKKDKNKNNTRNHKNDSSIVPYDTILDLYHDILPELPRVKKLTDKRKRQIKARWFESEKTQSVKWWEDFFHLVKSNAWLMGENDRNWKADLEWLTKEEKFLKVIENFYRKNAS